MLGCGRASLACLCIERPSCGPLRYLDADFVGEILSREAVQSGDMIGSYRVEAPRGNLFRVRVIESFRGAQKLGDIVNLLTGQGGGDCGYRFKVGDKYLIDAAAGKGVLFTGRCTLTARIEDSEPEIRDLRRIAANERAPDLTGVVLKHLGPFSDPGQTPLLGIPVSIKSEFGGDKYETVTDSDGIFTFPKLPHDYFSITVGLPSNLVASWANLQPIIENQISDFSIDHREGESAACRVNIIAEYTGSISGTIKTSNNKAAIGSVAAYTVTADGKPQDKLLSEYSNACGAFQLPHLPPGRYLVQFEGNAGIGKSDTHIVNLKDGEQIEGVILTVQRNR